LFFISQKRNRLFRQGLLEFLAHIPPRADHFGFGTVGENLVRVVDVDAVDGESVDGIPYHPVEAFVLSGSAQADGAFGQESRQGELVENLVVEILCHQQGILLTLMEQDFFGALGDKTGKNEGTDQNDHQTGEGEVLDQTKWFDALDWFWTGLQHFHGDRDQDFGSGVPGSSSFVTI